MSVDAFLATVRVWSRPSIAACAAMIVCVSLPSAAGATLLSSSSVETANGTVSDSGSANSAVHVDGENLAQSFVQPQLGRMGAAASNSLFEGASSSRSSFDDSWVCSGHCGVVGLPPAPIPLTLDFKLDGVLTDFVRPHGFGTGVPELDILARYKIEFGGVSSSFEFRLEENVFDTDEGPLGAGSRVSAVFCQGAACSPLAVDVVSFIDDADNDLFRFSIDAKGNQVLCPDNCVAGFLDDMSFRVGVVGGNNVSMIDALQTFQVTVNSLDPTSQFISAEGRTTAVPEPATLGLLGLGLLGLGNKRRLQQRRAKDCRA